MVRISSKSSIRSKRIHTSFVHRTRTLGERATSVEAVNPVNPVENKTAYSSANHLMSSDAFYEKLEELEKEYLNFYHSERNLQKAIKDIEDNINLDLIYMNNLVDKYNKTALALKRFDQQINTNHSENIKNILSKYKFSLNNMGIYIIENNKLKLDEEEFKIALLSSKDNGSQLFNPIKEMILKLYKAFRNIKGPNTDDLESKYGSFSNNDYSGLIMDKNS